MVSLQNRDEIESGDDVICEHPGLRRDSHSAEMSLLSVNHCLTKVNRNKEIALTQ